jgi:hypothetical protein
MVVCPLNQWRLMMELVLMRKIDSANQGFRDLRRRIQAATLLIFSFVIPGLLLETPCVVAQEWVARNTAQTAGIAPIAQLAAPTHLVIESPQPLKHAHSKHHGQPQIAMPTRAESIGGGYWNQQNEWDQGDLIDGEPIMEDEFSGTELPTAQTPKKKIDLTAVVPSHAHKTPRPIAIPGANRTTGWKQPYSYGHFGAKHNRQWSIHHGHQRSYTQWTFR